MYIQSLIILITIIFFSINPARASLQVNDDPVWGENSIVYDSSTGLDWLKPKFTVNNSYQTLSGLLGNAEYSNFRYANLNELGSLLSQFSLASSQGYYENLPLTNVTQFIDLFEPTIADSFNSATQGLLGNLFNGGTAVGSGGVGMFLSGSTWITFEHLGGGNSFTFQNPTFGSWLVKPHSVSSVPLPAAGWLFGFVIAGWRIIARRYSVPSQQIPSFFIQR